MHNLNMEMDSPPNDRLRNLIGSLVVILCLFPTVPMAMTELVAELVLSESGSHSLHPDIVAEAHMNTLAVALQQYRTSNREYPPTAPGLAALVRPLDNARVKKPILADGSLCDPWGNDYHYRLPSQTAGRPFDLWSSGPDGLSGTEDDIVHGG